MKNSAFLRLALLFTITLAVLVTVSETRGGRRGGGGSFIFWRRYKKPSFSGSTRRMNNMSPMQALAQSKSRLASGATGEKTHKHTKTNQHHQEHHHNAHLEQHHHYQQQHPHSKQQQFALTHSTVSNSYGGVGNQYGGGSYVPPGGTYYPNTAALPSDAVYYAQAPIRSQSGNDFLFGMMTGQLVRQSFRGGPLYHDPYVYQQAPKASGSAMASATATATTTANDGDNVPLAPFNLTPQPTELLQSTNQPQSSQVSTDLPSFEPASQPPSEVLLIPQPGGIICVPLLFNETDPTDPAELIQVQKTVCYPAPPVPPSLLASGFQCVTRTVTEPDPNEPTQTIQVQRQFCDPLVMLTTTSTEPPIVAGDIITSQEQHQQQAEEMQREKFTLADISADAA